MRKVLLMNGSPRPDGNTAFALKECAKAIEAAGVETEIISLAGKNIQSCTACMSCFENKKCAIDDGLNEIIDQIKESDGFIVGAPVYFGTPRGDVLSALQRIGYVSLASGGFLSRKVGGPVSLAANEGILASNQDMLVFFLANDMIVPGTDLMCGAKGQKPGDVAHDERGLANIRKFGDNVAFLINLLGKN
jgi:multimeric flavodoxin WrbA